jgi:UDP-N-acetyl-D-glucosamine dehydrogenase
VAKARRALNDRGLSVQGARVAVVGVSYMPGVGDVRESPALKIAGAEVLYHDPHVPSLTEFGLTSTPFEQALADVDLALILTAYPGVDHELIARRAGLVVDLHGVTRTANISNVMRL